MVRIQQKRQIRRMRRHSAWIYDDGRRECLVKDISLGGLSILIDGKKEISEQFELSFALNSPKRTCQVIWRHGKMIGIKFV